MKMAGVLTLCAALVTGTARAQEAPSPAPAPSPSSGGGDFDFDFAEPQKEDPDAARRALDIDKKVRLRRNMLTAHQVFGFTTLALLAATLVVGTLNYVDKFDGDFTNRYAGPHLGLAVASSATFTTGALLGLLAPNPYPKPVKLDAALFHKIFMATAAACFVTQLILGPVSASREGHLDQPDLALAHLVVGYGAFAFMTAGTISFLIK